MTKRLTYEQLKNFDYDMWCSIHEAAAIAGCSEKSITRYANELNPRITAIHHPHHSKKKLYSVMDVVVWGEVIQEKRKLHRNGGA